MTTEQALIEFDIANKAVFDSKIVIEQGVYVRLAAVTKLIDAINVLNDMNSSIA